MEDRGHEEQTLIYVVRIRSVEPPPEWPVKTTKKLERELELMYGHNVDVQLTGHDHAIQS